VFDEVTKKEGGKRAARRGIWLIGSSALQTALVLGIIAASTALAKRAAEDKLVEVKFVKQAAPTPPAPPPPPPAPKRKVVQQQKPKVDAKPRPAMVQPKEVPLELKPPDPNEPPEEEDSSDEGSEGGVVGGVVGGVSGGIPQMEKPRLPVEFNATMTAPQLISGPPLEYTQQALEREVEGTMLVKCLVRIDGSVQNCRVLKSVPFMDRAVVSVLERRRYKPATQGGQPLDMIEYTFTIKLKLPQ
jgi:periplasmic protein TonB